VLAKYAHRLGDHSLGCMRRPDDLGSRPATVNVRVSRVIAAAAVSAFRCEMRRIWEDRLVGIKRMTDDFGRLPPSALYHRNAASAAKTRCFVTPCSIA